MTISVSLDDGTIIFAYTDPEDSAQMLLSVKKGNLKVTNQPASLDSLSAALQIAFQGGKAPVDVHYRAFALDAVLPPPLREFYSSAPPPSSN